MLFRSKDVGPLKKNREAFEAALSSKLVAEFRATGVDTIYLDSFHWYSELTKRNMREIGKFVDNGYRFGQLWLVTDLVGIEKYAKKNGFKLRVIGGASQSWAALLVELEDEY